LLHDVKGEALVDGMSNGAFALSTPLLFLSNEVIGFSMLQSLLPQIFIVKIKISFS
jgi:hypothetical protein